MKFCQVASTTIDLGTTFINLSATIQTNLVIVPLRIATLVHLKAIFGLLGLEVDQIHENQHIY